MTQNMQRARWQRGFLKVPSFEKSVETTPLAEKLGGLTDLELVDFTNGLSVKPERSAFELKTYFHTVKDLFIDDGKGNGNPRIPFDVIRSIQDYTDSRIHV